MPGFIANSLFFIVVLVVKVVDEVADDDHYQQFLALQGKRERDWKVGRELARKKVYLQRLAKETALLSQVRPTLV